MDLSEVEKLEKPLDEAGELLMVAASLIEQRGLERVGYQNAEGGLCIQGALCVAQKQEPSLHPFDSRFMEALGKVAKALGGDYSRPHRWIRDPSVTKELVVAKMREAALL